MLQCDLMWQKICQSSWVVSLRSEKNWCDEYKMRSRWSKEGLVASPSGRFLRQPKRLRFSGSRCSAQWVVRSFSAIDRDLGIEVAWEEVPEVNLRRLCIPIQQEGGFGDVRHMSHDHIRDILTSWHDPCREMFILISPFMTGKTLHTFISLSGTKLKLTVIIQWILQLISVLEYMESNGLGYGFYGLRTDNIFVDPPTGALLVNRMDVLSISMCRSIPSVQHAQHLWSLGVCVLEMLTAQTPFVGHAPTVVADFARQGAVPASLYTLKDPARDFIAKCLSSMFRDGPGGVPDYASIKEHEFLSRAGEARAEDLLHKSPVDSDGDGDDGDDGVDGILSMLHVAPDPSDTTTAPPLMIPMVVSLDGDREVSFEFSPSCDTVDLVVEEMADAMQLVDEERASVKEQVIAQVHQHLPAFMRI